MKWTINHLEDLNKVAAEFLDYVGDKTIFALYGPMGVGKTTFVKAVAACLGVTDDVSSPTFALVNEYQTKNGKSLYHFDFYRVNSIAEALDFGYEEYFYGDGVCIVEWGLMIEELLPDDCIFIEITKNTEKGFDYRKITIESEGECR